MAKDHGLADLFSRTKADEKDDTRPVVPPQDYAGPDDQPPILEDADASPIERLRNASSIFDAPDTDNIDYDDDPYYDEHTRDEPRSFNETDPEVNEASSSGGILCFLLDDPIGARRMRTIAALNVAAGMGSVRLRTLPAEPEEMDLAIFDALQESDCELVAFLSPGTEPADDWALECQLAFTQAPRLSAIMVKQGNADPLNPWARTAFLLDIADRQMGKMRGADTMVFKREALEDLGPDLGQAFRSRQLVRALEDRGHRTGHAVEARVVLAEPEDKKDVLDQVRDNARAATRLSAAKKNFLIRPIYAFFILAGYPFRLMAVGKAVKKGIGREMMDELFPKAMAAVWADRKARAATMLRPGK
ncbi:MAG: hypothetical protein AAFX52_06300 [Pseudomonadota bacterium]